MKQSIFLKGFVCAVVAVPLIAGCKKKETTATEGSAAPTGSAGSAAPAGSAGSGSAVAAATGSGSAAAAGSAAGSAAPAQPGTPWAADSAAAPATSKLTAKRGGNDEGTFDRALYFKDTDKYGSTHYTLEISSNCDKFSCAHFDANISDRNGSFWTDCPSAKVMEVKLHLDADPKPGDVEVDIYVNGSMSGGGLMPNWAKGGSLTEVTDKEIKGKISFKGKGGKDAAQGEFAAKVCGAIVAPKE